MLYRDLVQFDPIETVVQLRTADEKSAAANLVQSYVFSDRMADLLATLVIPQLRIDRPVDSKGVLIVGNYGTGKSHLMSVISAIAEHRDLLDQVRHTRVRDAAAPIAGSFQVVRAEIGGVERSFRDIVLDELSRFLERAGTPYTFPPASQITNNKGPLIAAMDGFAQRYPNTGVLFVLDEMLDYLRTREERALILDLGFLRELGEVTAATPLRFIGGVQETLFDNPRFAFVAEQLRRVRDRFDQVRIAREDIAYVVSERLLHKTDAQIAQITEHLRKFTTLYPPMAERLGEYARLFPIHPAYIDTFEKVYVAEKREVLKTFSAAIRTVLDLRVPEREPGLISYDHYWGMLRENPSLRNLAGVAEVVDKSAVLEGRIQNAYTRKPLLPMALRIIHALSVHRLTTSELRARLGVTAEELRDQLCLWTPMPEADADFLGNTVQVALKEIMRTVSGQYITHNPDNGQYFLDLTKVIDFDAKIAERGNFMESRDLNRYFFDALQRFMNISASVHVTGYRIWPYELPWETKKVTRPGYLFFGPPNERSTAQPPRDFYLFILPPFRERAGERFRGEEDEVIFDLEGLGPDFEEIVRRYAGAQAMAAESPDYRATYDDKALEHLRALNTWLRQNMTSHLRVVTQSSRRTVPEVLAKTRSSASQDAEELLRVISAHLLAPCFTGRYQDYPAFTRLAQPVSEANRPNTAMDAVRFLAGRGRTNLAIGVLDGLKLLGENDAIKPLNSPYARHYLDLLLKRGETQVVNQGEIIEQVAGGVTPIFKDIHFKLEPEWVAVVLLALVYDGQISLSLTGDDRLIDAGNIDRAATQAMDTLADFRFYRRPRSLPLPVWTQIFDAFGLQSALLRSEQDKDREQAVAMLRQHVLTELNQVVEWLSKVQAGLSLWNTSLFTDRFAFTANTAGQVLDADLPTETLSQTALLPYLRKTKDFLEQLSRFDKPGKLRNLTLTTSDAETALADRRVALRARDVLEVVTQLQPLTSYLSEAGAVLPEDHTWLAKAQSARDALLDEARRMAKGEGAVDVLAWRRRLDNLRQEYVQAYTELHTRYVLGPSDDDRRARMLRGPKVEQLKALASVDILSRQELDRLAKLVSDIPTCRNFHADLLVDRPTCPQCNFRPPRTAGPTAAVALDALAGRLDTLLNQWHAALRQNLQSETARSSLAAMTATERQPIDTYLTSAAPADAVLPQGLVKAANQALRGLKTLPVSAERLVEALLVGGMPCTADELEQRLQSFLRRAMSGHDRGNTRLTIEQE